MENNIESVDLCYSFKKGGVLKAKNHFMDYVISRCGLEANNEKALKEFVSANKTAILRNFHKSIERFYSVGIDKDVLLWSDGKLVYNKGIKNKQEFEIGIQVVFLKTVYDLFCSEHQEQLAKMNVMIDVNQYKKLTNGFFNTLVSTSEMYFLLKR